MRQDPQSLRDTWFGGLTPTPCSTMTAMVEIRSPEVNCPQVWGVVKVSSWHDGVN